MFSVLFLFCYCFCLLLCFFFAVLVGSLFNVYMGSISIINDRIGWVMVSVLASSAVDRGFEPRSGLTKDCKIGMCCFSAKHAALRGKSRLVGSESG